jgi:hypothetical protein
LSVALSYDRSARRTPSPTDEVAQDAATRNLKMGAVKRGDQQCPFSGKPDIEPTSPNDRI